MSFTIAVQASIGEVGVRAKLGSSDGYSPDLIDDIFNRVSKALEAAWNLDAPEGDAQDGGVEVVVAEGGAE